MEVQRSATVVGFDSAWTDNQKAPGAVCAIRLSGAASFRAPRLASFDQALDFIRAEQALSDVCLVALDQPTIVPNEAGMRPVDRVAASVISWVGGGVQPANRSKKGMFDDAAPIWSFKRRLAAEVDPERARTAPSGLFLMEVFPALALVSLHDAFFGRLSGPRYNPQRKKTFKISDWQAVVGALRGFVRNHAIEDVDNWLDNVALLPRPAKADQDKLDALLCAIIGLHWLTVDRAESVKIGDSVSGYMVAPASPDLLARLRAAGERYGVPVS